MQPSNTLIYQTLLNATLMYYDRSKPSIVQTDASKYRLGTILIQSSHPIAFANKTLTDVETHYANIEHECLSVYFSVNKFHTYICGGDVTVHHDQKLLEMIQQKPIHVATPQLQHMLLHMQKYYYTIHYKPGEDMVLADCLSYSPHINSLPIPLAQNVQHVQLCNAELDIIQDSVE